MTTVPFPQHTLFKNAIALDEATGLPLDYDSFAAAYRPLMLAAAERLGISPQDREDAVQEVQVKFWQKNGLGMYDSAHKTKFSTLLRKWTGMFMLQERDKVIRSKRVSLIDPGNYAEDIRFDEPQDNIEFYNRQELIKDWVKDAHAALEASGKPYLSAVLNLCLRAADDGTAPSRAQVAEAAGVSINRATPLLKELRAVLTEANLGIESLYSR